QAHAQCGGWRIEQVEPTPIGIRSVDVFLSHCDVIDIPSIVGFECIGAQCEFVVDQRLVEHTLDGIADSTVFGAGSPYTYGTAGLPDVRRVGDVLDEASHRAR